MQQFQQDTVNKCVLEISSLILSHVNVHQLALEIYLQLISILNHPVFNFVPIIIMQITLLQNVYSHVFHLYLNLKPLILVKHIVQSHISLILIITLARFHATQNLQIRQLGNVKLHALLPHILTQILIPVTFYVLMGYLV